MQYNDFYQNLIRLELNGIYGHAVLQEMDEIIRYYSLYDGRPPETEEGAPRGLLKTNLVKKLINDESRFMVSRLPEIKIVPKNEADAQAADVLEKWIGELLEKNKWASKLLKGVRDCMIGKRAAIKLSGAPGKPIRIRIAPSMEFVYDVDDEEEQVSKAVFFHGTTPETVIDRTRQRIWRQRYVMENGRCYLDEGLYDGTGAVVEITSEHADTGLDFLPVHVVVNGGLSGDLLGESDVMELETGQLAYDDAKTDNRDALKYNMFPQKVFTDSTQECMEKIKIAPNAMIDLVSDPSATHQASASILESSFEYCETLEKYQERIKNDMHELLSVPRITPDQLTGIGTSGKAMRALYWSLICRCEEKWADSWDDALRWLVDSCICMARSYGEKLPDIVYTVQIDHLYPIIDDEEDERAQDLTEVMQQARSRRSYLDKWQKDTDSDAELAQIKREQTMLEDAFAGAVGDELNH